MLDAFGIIGMSVFILIIPSISPLGQEADVLS